MVAQLKSPLPAWIVLPLLFVGTVAVVTTWGTDSLWLGLATALIGALAVAWYCERTLRGLVGAIAQIARGDRSGAHPGRRARRQRGRRDPRPYERHRPVQRHDAESAAREALAAPSERIGNVADQADGPIALPHRPGIEVGSVRIHVPADVRVARHAIALLVTTGARRQIASCRLAVLQEPEWLGRVERDIEIRA